MKKKIQDSVVVIMGASSNTGRAVAISFARRGANVVLAGENRWQLFRAASECEMFGVYALCVTTDLSDENSIQNLARRALSKFGSVDIWVNNPVELTRSNGKKTSTRLFFQY